MNRRSMQQLKLDKRLTGRRGWISAQDLERELEALPDVSHKLAAPEPPPSGGDEGEPEPQPTQ
jgi:hypothetical protein